MAYVVTVDDRVWLLGAENGLRVDKYFSGPGSKKDGYSGYELNWIGTGLGLAGIGGTTVELGGFPLGVSYCLKEDTGLGGDTLNKVDGDSFTYVITRTKAKTVETINWFIDTADLPTTAASEDYFIGNAYPAGTVTFNKGELKKTFTIPTSDAIIYDVDQPNVQFKVHIASTAGNLVSCNDLTGDIHSYYADLKLKSICGDYQQTITNSTPTKGNFLAQPSPVEVRFMATPKMGRTLQSITWTNTAGGSGSVTPINPQGQWVVFPKTADTNVIITFV
jgi:hypothetical protein